MNYLPLVFDGILILVFAVCIIDGRKKGFVKTVLSLVSLIISFAVAQSLAAPVAAWANEAFAKEAVSSYVENYIEDSFENSGIDYSSGLSSDENVPDEITAMLEKYGVSFSDIAEGEKLTIKVFLWNSVSGMTPISYDGKGSFTVPVTVVEEEGTITE